MTTDNVCDGLANGGDQPWVLQYADRRVGSRMNFLELMMPVEIDLPANFLELFDKASFNEMNRSLIDAQLRL